MPVYSFKKLNSNYMRKEGKGRKYRQQFIDVPKFLIKEGLSEEEAHKAKEIKKLVPDAMQNRPDLFRPNKSPFAGKRKRIVHQLAPKY
jgi:hypothetical protein